MSLRDEFDGALTEIFSEFDDVPIVAELIEITGAGTYTPASGRVVPTETHDVNVFLLKLTESQARELCGGLGNYEILLQLSTVSYMPKVGDHFEIDSEKYYINLVNTDPARVSLMAYCSTGAPITDGLK